MQTPSVKSRGFLLGLSVLIVALCLVIWIQCSDQFKAPTEQKDTKQSDILSKANPQVSEVIRIQNKNTNDLISIPGVVGVGTGMSKKGKGVIRVFTAEENVSGIPKNVEGVPVEIKITGHFRPLADPTARFPRPVPIGSSTGHPDVTAGTIGCRVRDTQGNVYALSNNHVFAYSNGATIGDNALQPGTYDGGSDPTDAIGTLYDFEVIKFDGTDNVIDAAIVLSSPSLLNLATPSDGYIVPSSTTVLPVIGQKVQKFGRTTGWTFGEVSEINVTVNVCYECNDPLCWSCAKLATFVNQISITPGEFSDGGDSGSLIITDDEYKNPVGLLFSGSAAVTIANPIDLVLQRFDVSIDDGGLGGNNLPHAEFTSETSELLVTFTDISTDSDGQVVSWSWDFGDGNTSTEQNPVHTYATEDLYSVALTVIDDGGAASSSSKRVLAGELPNNPPTADFIHTSSGLTATFTDNSTDTDGNIVFWSWNFGDGFSSTETNPIHTYTEGGIYLVTLTVTDDDGDIDDVSKNVFIDASSANEPPSAEFSYTTSELMVTFTDQSTDSDGSILGRHWDFGDGSTSPAKDPIHFYSESGTYTVTLTVTDNDGANDSITKDVTVSTQANNPPDADFIYTTSGLTVTFTDQSADSDGSIIAWSWNFGDGSPISSAKNPFHSYAADGAYTVTLTVTDNDLATDIISKVVNVSGETNDPPVADFTYAASGLTVTFTDQSTDSDGSIVSWSWDFGDGNGSSEKDPVHTYSSSGTFSVALTVTDDDGATDVTSKFVTVTQETNDPPVADFTYAATELTVTFTDQSTDSDGSVVSWSWDFGDGNGSSEKNPVHTYSSSGTFSVALTVTDDDGATDVTSKFVTVTQETNDPPIADFTYETSGLTVTFTNQSTDSDGNIISWSWDFGDGSATSPAQNPIHMYTEGGTYTVTLTVTDNELATDTISKVVTVTGGTNEPPVANFTYTAYGLILVFTDQSTDSDGNILSWSWDFGDGTPVSAARNPMHIFPKNGKYTVTLTVTDNDLATGSHSQSILVKK